MRVPFFSILHYNTNPEICTPVLGFFTRFLMRGCLPMSPGPDMPVYPPLRPPACCLFMLCKKHRTCSLMKKTQVRKMTNHYGRPGRPVCGIRKMPQLFKRSPTVLQGSISLRKQRKRSGRSGLKRRPRLQRVRCGIPCGTYRSNAGRQSCGPRGAWRDTRACRSCRGRRQ